MSKLAQFIMTRGWALEGAVLRQGLAIVRRHAAGMKLERSEIDKVVQGKEFRREQLGRPPLTRAGDRGYYMLEGGVAVIPVEGVLSKWASLVNGQSQPEGTTMEALVEAFDAARADESVHAVLVDFDSPGGTADGTSEAAAALARLTSVKPTAALSRDQMYSAAYWIGSQAGAVYVTPTSGVGSIGVYAVVEDASRMFAEEGIDVHVVRDGQFKGRFVEGQAVTPEALGQLGEEIRTLGRLFRAAVAEGRGRTLAQVEAVADGRTFLGRDAVTLGLADGVRTFDELVEQLREGRRVLARGTSGDRRMTLKEVIEQHPGLAAELEQIKTLAIDEAVAEERARAAKAPAPAASLAELREQFAGDDLAAFREQCLARGLSLAAAAAERCKALAAENAELRERLKKAEDLNKAGLEGGGTQPLQAGPSAEGLDPFEARVTEIRRGLVADGMPADKASGEAWKRAAAENPKAHEEWKQRQADRPRRRAS